MTGPDESNRQNASSRGRDKRQRGGGQADKGRLSRTDTIGSARNQNTRRGERKMREEKPRRSRKIHEPSSRTSKRTREVPRRLEVAEGGSITSRIARNYAPYLSGGRDTSTPKQKRSGGGGETAARRCSGDSKSLWMSGGGPALLGKRGGRRRQAAS